MEEGLLYKKIAESIRLEILKNRLKPGERLPSIREMTRTWNCTPGTVQRAYQELARQDLVVSQAGRGTHVSANIDPASRSAQPVLRRASVVNRAEAFLLELITAGYSVEEVQQSISLAADRWRTLQTPLTPKADNKLIRFAGSHDLGVLQVATALDLLARGVQVVFSFGGSLAGLIALAEGKCDVAGCHLWDADTNTYNESFVRKLFPGKQMLLTHFAERWLGLIFSPENPFQLQSLADLVHPGVRFVNRQSGSGTRVWLDESLRREGIEPASISGYNVEKATHSEVARAIAEGEANAGIGLQSAASAFSLGFLPLVKERYDLISFASLGQNEPLSSFLAWIGSFECKEQLALLSGYDTKNSGEQRFLYF